MNTQRRILFCSEHCLADPVSGAAISASEMLSLLTFRGWDVAVLCGSKVDGQAKGPAVRAEGTGGAGANGVGVEVVRRYGAPEERLAVQHLSWRGLATRIVRPFEKAATEGAGEGAQAAESGRLVALLKLFEHEIKTRRPEIVMTYGGGWFGRAVLKMARKHGLPTVFWLRNTYYERADLFEDVTGIIVPSSHTARHYGVSLGLSCQVLFSVVTHARVHCPVRQPKYLTYVSPMPEKGVFFFARLASELGRLRPDIEILIVEGRGSVEWLRRTNLDVLGLANVRLIPRVEDPRQFLAVTRALVFPSAWPETFGRTAVEAMISGIPVLSSNRGGMPEIVGMGGVVLPLPERITHQTALTATVSEVQPWVEVAARIWDDEAYYRELSRNAVASVARFDPDTITDRTDVLLREWAATETAVRPIEPVNLLAACGFPGDAGLAWEKWAGLEAAEAEALLA